jgi:putative photosynthetic complex assembly protein
MKPQALPPPVPQPHAGFPRSVLFGAAALLLATMGAIVVGRMVGPAPATDPGTPVTVRELRFQDRADGGVAVLDAADGQLVVVLQPGQDGFIRATMRGLARERRQGAAAQDIPFRLSVWPDGRLSLADLATGRSIDINAFGISQVEAFSRLLPARTQTSSVQQVGRAQ